MRHIRVPTTLFIALTAALAWGGFQAPAAAQQAPQPAPAVAQPLTAQPPATAGAPVAVLIPDDRTAAETESSWRRCSRNTRQPSAGCSSSIRRS